MLSFGLLRAHLFLGSFPAFVYLWPVTIIFYLWAKFSPWLQSARLWSVNMLGHFHSVIKYGLLTMARYGRPMNGRFQLYPVYSQNAVCLAHVWPIDHTARIRPIDDTARRRPIVSTARRRPTVSTARRRPSVTTVNIAHGYCGLVLKNRLLQPLANRGKRTAMTTSKQINKTTRK